MDTARLSALKVAIAMFLGLDVEIRRALVGLIAEPPPKPEPVHRGAGFDAHPPPHARAEPQSAPTHQPRPHAGKGRSKPTAAEIKAADDKLLDALRDHPGVGVLVPSVRF